MLEDALTNAASLTILIFPGLLERLPAKRSDELPDDQPFSHELESRPPERLLSAQQT